MTEGIILEARGLSKEFGGFVAVKDVKLQVRGGTIHALNGPNGAGKNTVFNARTKAEPALGGGNRLFGQKIFITYSDHDRTARIVHLMLATARQRLF